MSSNWDNFKRNDEIRIWRRATRNRRDTFWWTYDVSMKLKLRAIEITPEREVYGGEEEQGRWWHSRDIILYYGWAEHKK